MTGRSRLLLGCYGPACHGLTDAECRRYALVADFESSSPTWVEIGLSASPGDPIHISSRGGMAMYAQAFYNVRAQATQ